MQARVDWVLKIFGTQVTKKKRPVRPVFPDYLSVSYDYAFSKSIAIMSIGDVEVTVPNGACGVMCCFFEAR